MSLGTTITEKEYRTLKYNSSSSLKDFSKDRRKYYKKYILEERVKEKENKAANMGRLVETLLMEPDRFDDLFFMSSCVKIPGGMLGDFIWNLSELVSDSDSTVDFEDVASEAYKKAGFKIAFKTVIAKLDDPINKLYYDECLKVNHLKMTMVTVLDVDNAEKIVHELKTNPTTAGICNLEDGSSITFSIYNQMKVENYEIDGMKLKSMLDKVIVNHKEKTVHIYDLKCTWAVEAFYKEYYLYRQAYIQAYLYWQALLYLANSPDSSIYGYIVKHPQFIVCDSINYYQPLIYTLSPQDMVDAYEGFTHKYTFYPGVRQIIEELQWAIKEDIWSISKTNYDKNGILNIKD